MSHQNAIRSAVCALIFTMGIAVSFAIVNSAQAQFDESGFEASFDEEAATVESTDTSDESVSADDESLTVTTQDNCTDEKRAAGQCLCGIVEWTEPDGVTRSCRKNGNNCIITDTKEQCNEFDLQRARTTVINGDPVNYYDPGARQSRNIQANSELLDYKPELDGISSGIDQGFGIEPGGPNVETGAEPIVGLGEPAGLTPEQIADNTFTPTESEPSFETSFQQSLDDFFEREFAPPAGSGYTSLGGNTSLSPFAGAGDIGNLGYNPNTGTTFSTGGSLTGGTPTGGFDVGSVGVSDFSTPYTSLGSIGGSSLASQFSAGNLNADNITAGFDFGSTSTGFDTGALQLSPTYQSLGFGGAQDFGGFSIAPDGSFVPAGFIETPDARATSYRNVLDSFALPSSGALGGSAEDVARAAQFVNSSNGGTPLVARLRTTPEGGTEFVLEPDTAVSNTPFSDFVTTARNAGENVADVSRRFVGSIEQGWRSFAACSGGVVECFQQGVITAQSFDPDVPSTDINSALFGTEPIANADVELSGGTGAGGLGSLFDSSPISSSGDMAGGALEQSDVPTQTRETELLSSEDQIRTRLGNVTTIEQGEFGEDGFLMEGFTPVIENKNPIERTVETIETSLNSALRTFTSRVPERQAGQVIVADSTIEAMRARFPDAYEQGIRRIEASTVLSPEAKESMKRGMWAFMSGIESNLDPRAVSPTGAAGIAQFTEGTWKDIMPGVPLEGRFDPELSVEATIRLAERNFATIQGPLERSGLDPSLGIFMAHNVGAGNAARALAAYATNSNIDSQSVISAGAYGPNRNLWSGSVGQAVERMASRMSSDSTIRVADSSSRGASVTTTGFSSGDNSIFERFFNPVVSTTQRTYGGASDFLSSLFGGGAANTGGGTSVTSSNTTGGAGDNAQTPAGAPRLTCTPNRVLGDGSQSITIRWSCPDATSATRIGFLDDTTGAATGESSVLVSATDEERSTYGIRCSNGQERSCSVAIVNPVINIIASPTTVSSGGRAQLIWSSVETRECAVIDPTGAPLIRAGSSGSVATQHMERSATFLVACESTLGTLATSSTTVLVEGDDEEPLEAALFNTSGSSQTTTNTSSGDGPTIINAQTGAAVKTCDPRAGINQFIRCLGY